MIGMFDCCGKRHDGAPEVLRAATRLRFAPGARQRVPCLGSQALLCVPFLCRFPPLALTHPPHALERGRTPSRAHRKRRCDTLHATRGLSAAWVSKKSARRCNAARARGAAARATHLRCTAQALCLPQTAPAG